MDFHQIESFIALCDTLHFAKAAARVHLSPSALSRIISKLEEELGVSLLERDTRRVSLTEDGLLFLTYAKEFIFKKDELLFQIGKRDDSLKGIFRIYASVTACYSILPPFAEELSKTHPLLRISVETGDPAFAADAVREGRVDLSLGALPFGGFADLDTYSVRKTPLVFVTAANGPFGSLGKQTDIVKETPLILPKNGLARERFDKWVKENNCKPTIAAETSGNEALLALARLGMGIALVPRLVLENGPFAEGMVFYPASSDFGDYDIGFMQKKLLTGSENIKKLRAAVTALILKTYSV